MCPCERGLERGPGAVGVLVVPLAPVHAPAMFTQACTSGCADARHVSARPPSGVPSLQSSGLCTSSRAAPNTWYLRVSLCSMRMRQQRFVLHGVSAANSKVQLDVAPILRNAVENSFRQNEVFRTDRFREREAAVKALQVLAALLPLFRQVLA